MPKLKWRVSEAPTGRYRSFSKRSWPTAYLGDKIAFQLYCDDAYAPVDVKAGRHAGIKINVADYRGHINGWTWRTLKRRGATLDEAKTIAQQFANECPEWFVNDSE